MTKLIMVMAALQLSSSAFARVSTYASCEDKFVKQISVNPDSSTMQIIERAVDRNENISATKTENYSGQYFVTGNLNSGAAGQISTLILTNGSQVGIAKTQILESKVFVHEVSEESVSVTLMGTNLRHKATGALIQPSMGAHAVTCYRSNK